MCQRLLTQNKYKTTNSITIKIKIHLINETLPLTTVCFPGGKKEIERYGL